MIPLRFNVPAKGRIRSDGKNKTEAAYERHLDLRRRAGEVLWYRFEAINLRLADNTYYRPDFLVMLDDGTIEVHEIKGHWEDDARVKIKVAASQFPFVFRAFKSINGNWTEELF